MTTEAKIQKHVDEAMAKLGVVLSSDALGKTEVKERVGEILSNLALRSAMSGGPEKCKECEEKLDPRLAVRCPKHIAMALATDFAKAKAKEHGPALITKAMMGAQEWFEKVTKTDDEEPEKTS
jgi:hypothetical protein